MNRDNLKGAKNIATSMLGAQARRLAALLSRESLWIMPRSITPPNPVCRINLLISSHCKLPNALRVMKEQNSLS
jgi:hypothetical protein